MNVFQKLIDFLNRLDDTGLVYTLEHNREDAIMVVISKDGERWEVEYIADGDVDVEIFYSDDDDLEDEDALERLFEDEDGEDDSELDDEDIEDLLDDDDDD